MRSALEVNPGIVSDETSYSSPGFYSDGNNVRFRYGKVEVVGGWTTFNASTLTGVCRSALSWSDSLAQTNVAFGTNSALMVIKTGVLYDITPAGLDTGAIDSVYYDGGYGSGGYGMGGYGVGGTEDIARTWSLDNWGEALIASPSEGAIYIWENDPGAVATVISQAPSSCQRVIVTPERQILALGCAEEVSGIYNPVCIRGSHTGDYTDWTTASDNNAFEHILEGGGEIVDAKVFGATVLIWTDKSLFIGQFIGQADQAYRFDKVADNCGAAGPQATVVFGQTAYWMTPDLRFFAYTYGGAATEMRCTISREFRDNIDTSQIAKVVCQSNSQFGEVWWYYPDERDGDENSRYIMVNVANGSWSKGDTARTAAIDSGTILYPLTVDYAGQTYLHENGQSANGSPLSWYIQTTPQYMGEAEQRFMVRGIWPDIEAQTGNITLTVYGREYPQATDVTKGTYTLAAGRQKKDFRASSRMISIRLSGSAAGTFMRLGKPSFDVAPLGLR